MIIILKNYKTVTQCEIIKSHGIWIRKERYLRVVLFLLYYLVCHNCLCSSEGATTGKTSTFTGMLLINKQNLKQTYADKKTQSESQGRSKVILGKINVWYYTMKINVWMNWHNNHFFSRLDNNNNWIYSY